MPNAENLAWPGDAVIITCAVRGTERADNMACRVAVACRLCGVPLYADARSIATATLLPERTGRPIDFFCVDCTTMHDRKSIDTLIDCRRPPADQSPITETRFSWRVGLIYQEDRGPVQVQRGKLLTFAQPVTPDFAACSYLDRIACGAAVGSVGVELGPQRYQVFAWGNGRISAGDVIEGVIYTP